MNQLCSLKIKDIITIANTDLRVKPLGSPTTYLEYPVKPGLWYIKFSTNANDFELIAYHEEISSITDMKQSLFKIAKNNQFTLFNQSNLFLAKIPLEEDFLPVDDVGFVFAVNNGSYIVSEYYINQSLISLKVTNNSKSRFNIHYQNGLNELKKYFF